MGTKNLSACISIPKHKVKRKEHVRLEIVLRNYMAEMFILHKYEFEPNLTKLDLNSTGLESNYNNPSTCVLLMP
jgi:hypothetical protein